MRSLNHKIINILLLILKVFISPYGLSDRTILSAHTHALPQAPTQSLAHKQGLMTEGNSSAREENMMLDLKESKEYFFRTGRGRSFHVSLANYYDANNTCFKAYLYSTDSQHGNLHQSSLTTSRVTYFILQADTGTCVSHSQYRENSEEVLPEKNEVEWTG